MNFKTLLGDSLIVHEAIEDDILVKDSTISFTCKLCKTSMSGVIPAETHLQGAKHKRAVQNHCVGVTSEQSSSFDGQDSSTSKVQAAIASGLVSCVYMEGLNVTHYKCVPCNKPCTGLAPMNQHLVSESHAKKLRDEAMRLSFSPHKAAPSATSTPTNQQDNSPRPAGMSSVQGNEVEQAMEEGIIRHADTDPSHLKCCVCDIACTGREAMKQHLQGRSHCKKQRAFQSGVRSARSETPEYYPTSSVSDTTPTDKTTIADIPSELQEVFISSEENGYVCSICDIVCNSHTQVVSHVQGEQHKKQLRLNLLLQWSSSPARAGTDTSYSPATSTQANGAGCINVIPPPQQFEDPDIETESPAAQKMEHNFQDYLLTRAPYQITPVKHEDVPRKDCKKKNPSEKILNLLSDIQVYMPDDSLSDLFDE